MAKKANDRTVVHVENKMNGVVKSQVEGMAPELASNQMVKNLMSSVLSKDTTVMEYDMSQAMGMQFGFIVTMIVTWIFHFKFGQVQPLLVTIISGYCSLVYNPLFQVYILGKNLERPFKTPKPAWLQESEASNATDTTESTADEETTTPAEAVEEEVTVEIEVEEEEDGSDSDSDSDSDEEEE